MRRIRNRILRTRVIETTDLDRACESKWTWGTDGKVAWMSVLSILHDLGKPLGLFVALWLDEDVTDPDDPRWHHARLSLRKRPDGT